MKKNHSFAIFFRCRFGDVTPIFSYLLLCLLLFSGKLCEGQESMSNKIAAQVNNTVIEIAPILDASKYPISISNDRPELDSITLNVIQIERKDMFKTYVHKVQKAGKIYLELFDGTELKNIIYPQSGTLIATSQDQQYYSITKIRKDSEGDLYETEIRNTSDEVIAKTILEPLGSEETEDEIFPLNGGEGIVQKAFFIGSGFKCKVFLKTKNQELSQQFFLDKSNYSNPNLTISDDNRILLISYEISDVSGNHTSTYIEAMSLTGSRYWKVDFKEITIKSKLYLSDFDGKIAFVGKKKNNDNNKYLYIINDKGEVVKVFEVYKGGLYNLRFDHEGGENILLAPSDGAYFYVIDLNRLEIINKSTIINASYYVQSMICYKGVRMATYFTGSPPDGIKNRDFALTEQGIILEDEKGNIQVNPLPIKGYPKIHKNKDQIYIICDPIDRKEIKQPIYQIIVKL